jgi:hypothetical protein
MSTADDDIFRKSDVLAQRLMNIIDLPLLNDSHRIKVGDVACSLSFEHWHAVRALLESGLLPSASVVHRVQFETLVRAVWITYAASDDDIDRLSNDLTLESEQAAKNMPQASIMLAALEKSGPREAHEALNRFKHYSWKALNSYVHAGIHSIQRHGNGYPIQLIHGVLCNANGLAVMSAMQAVVLSGEQPLQRDILDLASAFSECMPPPL